MVESGDNLIELPRVILGRCDVDKLFKQFSRENFPPYITIQKSEAAPPL